MKHSIAEQTLHNVGDFVLTPFVREDWVVWEGHRIVYRDTQDACESWAHAETARRAAARDAGAGDA